MSYGYLCQIKIKLIIIVIIIIIIIIIANTLPADEKYNFLNRHNLTIPIQIQLSRKQQTFSQFFSPPLKFSLKLEYFEKKMTVRAFVFPLLRTPKTWLDKCLKSSVSDARSTRNMVNVPKDC